MFKALHALAQKATLMIVITAEGDELRVNVTPVHSGDKAQAHELRPLSVLATADELETDFAEALSIWQAPKRSLLDQARDVVDDNGTATGNAGAGSKKTVAKKPAEPKKKAPPAAKGSAPAQDGDETAAGAGSPAGDAVPAVGAPAGEAAPAPAPAADTPPADPAPAADAEVVDTFTLDLF